MSQAKKYWFPAKHYGWGWGPPSAWQGWAVIALFVALVVAGIFVFPPQHELYAFILYAVALNVGLMIICWLKGEPPKWRWGNKWRP